MRLCISMFCERRMILLLCILFLFLAGCDTVSSPMVLSPATPTLERVDSTTISNPCFESGCHSELKANEALYKHEPYVDEKCLDCHVLFHTASTQRLYTQSDIELCYNCHPLAILGNTHPVGEGVIDPNTNQMMTCTSTCHRSHTAPYEYLLTLSSNGELCVSCHQELIGQ
jgi:predicted CXXCH cytochrome family protein